MQDDSLNIDKFDLAIDWGLYFITKTHFADILKLAWQLYPITICIFRLAFSPLANFSFRRAWQK